MIPLVKCLFMTLLFSSILCAEIDTANTICSCEREAILLNDIKELDLHKGAFTVSRRIPSIPQLECTGGSAKGDKEPSSIRCVNVGRSEPHWRCEADVDTNVELGNVVVSCEGYSGPHDPYVLHGSCGLKYTLEYTHWGAFITGYIARAINILILTPLKWIAYIAGTAFIGLIAMAKLRPRNRIRIANAAASQTRVEEEEEEEYEEEDEEGEGEEEEIEEEETLYEDDGEVKSWEGRLRVRNVPNPHPVVGGAAR